MGCCGGCNPEGCTTTVERTDAGLISKVLHMEVFLPVSRPNAWKGSMAPYNAFDLD